LAFTNAKGMDLVVTSKDMVEAIVTMTKVMELLVIITLFLVFQK
jgi:hypothetical protein